jgi:hypothetical protein
MNKKLSVFFLFLCFIIVLLSGCMYPEDEKVQNHTAYVDQVQMVQAAINQFQKDNNGILPIKNSVETTPIYQKYVIDFKRIVPEYMAEPPSNAFESGGVFQYVIVLHENVPIVKIFDLRIAEILSELKLRVNVQGYPPFKEKIANNVYTLDYKRLGYTDEPFVVSPFTNRNLSFVINGNAEIFVDYRIDLYEALKKQNGTEFQKGEDIRDLLLEDSLFVPVYSLPYTIDENTNEPIFLEK